MGAVYALWCGFIRCYALWTNVVSCCRSRPKLQCRVWSTCCCRYCNQVLSREIDECCTQLLQHLVCGQDHAYESTSSNNGVVNTTCLYFGLHGHQLRCWYWLTADCYQLPLDGITFITIWPLSQSQVFHQLAPNLKKYHKLSNGCIWYVSDDQSVTLQAGIQAVYHVNLMHVCVLCCYRWSAELYLVWKKWQRT